MAKKRKNDTRLDPFATAVGSSSLDALLEQANAGDVIRMPAPSDPSREITLVCKVISHSDIESTTQVYGKNRRVQSLLNEKSVSDILPAIKEDGRNQHPALLWDQGDTSLVLAGSRRRKACILGNADYLVLSSSDFTDQDAKILAVSSDQYIAPSLWELGQAYQNTKNELIEQGKKGSYREIAVIEGVSHTAVADAIKAFEQIPADVVALYPTANHVGREVAKKLISAKERDQAAFNLLVADIANHEDINAAASDDKRAMAITKYLTTEPQIAVKREVVLESNFVSVQRSLKNGDVSVKINNKVMTDKRLEQLTKLLAAFN
ncbi:MULTISPECIES: transcriptional regulator [Pseudoalteromonas]|uniref:Transcriptional regulator for chromosome partitioning (ParB family protein) n=2 Tax=Pseudoalteromonas TaxID=53246 RepID=Q3ICM6_PSET1|nr:MULTISPECIES: transcriptional regulator [Pseudoalteromonas]ASM55665.1 chromosome partitioning protein, ParB family [Pseudoalteromonas nigrifaciens]MBB1371902.1 transcriptional regulator [Pseudoalteromonas sp. SR45-4]MBB1407032.1 transcriptional regulator [Pseudoalteromonas sp. SG44-5]MBE0420666.1 transcriptional regulator [Pseudoalteromonas nigrifaciens]MBH0072783.1 transcriptional regulator [Pseudoalteromonas sp. NZS127]|tara:strand:+ start:4194 stop:5156 length:963 start_codon:yes stop_codon:yes gene_type:complete